MRKLEKRRVSICILVSLLLWASLYGLSSNIIEPSEGKPFSFTSSKELPLHRGESHSILLPPWQVSERNAVFARSATEISSSGVLTLRSGNAKGTLQPSRCEIALKNKETSFRVDSLSSAFKLVDRQACQHLDIPPPHA